MCACSVTQLCPALCDPMVFSMPGSSVHRILQARLLEWVTISSSRQSSQTRYQTHLSCVPLHGKMDSLPLSRLRSPSASSGRDTYINVIKITKKNIERVDNQFHGFIVWGSRKAWEKKIQTQIMLHSMKAITIHPVWIAIYIPIATHVILYQSQNLVNYFVLISRFEWGASYGERAIYFQSC